QEQAILAEHNLLKGQLQSATPGDRKQVRTQVQQEAKSWAQQNGVNVRWLWLQWHHHKVKN
ncbi:MAG TPA: hypothetical protein VMR75_01245, partial [Candidatus Saccharimonadales bacterium]|nr:hypothetical protein [Candidatus Saccharimonadales bacterium]